MTEPREHPLQQMARLENENRELHQRLAAYEATIAGLKEQVNKYRERLEIGFAFDQDWNRIELPNDDGPDGIECRDETIRLMEAAIAKFKQQVTSLTQELFDEKSLHAATQLCLKAQTESVAELRQQIQQIHDALRQCVEALVDITDAADGLSRGVDWNKGNHAILHGYRKKLLASITPAQQALSNLLVQAMRKEAT